MKRQRHTKKPDLNVECPVCGGPVEGFHFGIRSCRPCSSFFRRTVAAKHEYTCSLNSNCELNYKNRTMCKGCRFNGCLSAGMNVKSVQHNRDPIGSKKQRNMPEMKALKSEDSGYSAPSICSIASTSSDDTNSSLLNKMVNAYHAFCRSERSLYALLFPEHPVLSVEDYKLVKHSDFIKMERGALSFVYAMVLEWVPHFSTFSTSTKMEIFRKFFGCFTCLIKSYRTSVCYPTGDKTVMSYGQYLDTNLEYHFQDDADPKLSAVSSFDLYYLTRRSGTKMKQLGVRELEFISLSCMIFLNEISIMLPEVEEVRHMQDKIICELHENISQVYGPQMIGVRIGSLILLLTDCDFHSRKVMEAVTAHRVFNPHLLELWED